MCIVMEVLDSRPTSTPSVATSPSDPSLPPHLDLRGLSPSGRPVANECTPERVSPGDSTPLQQDSPHYLPNEGKTEGISGTPASPYSFSVVDQQGLQGNKGLPCGSASPVYADPPCDLPPGSPSGSRKSLPALKGENGEGVDNERLPEHQDQGPPSKGGSEEEQKPSPLLPVSSPVAHACMLNAPPEDRGTVSSIGEVSRCPGPPSASLDDPCPSPKKEKDPGFDEGPPLLPLDQDRTPVSAEDPPEEVQHSQPSILDEQPHPTLQEPPQAPIEEQPPHHHHLHPHLHNHHHHHHHQQQQQQQQSQQQVTQQQQPHHHLHPYGEGHLQEYQHSLLKLPLHLQDSPQGLVHDFDEHPQALGQQRHSQEPLGDPPHHQHPPSSDRSHEGYWNMHLAMLRKVKTEPKDLYEREGLVPDGFGNAPLKSSDQHELYNYRIPPHPNMGPESPSPINGSRPSPLPHGSLPFSQSPDQRQHHQHQQHYQAYPNHVALRDMSPMSPGFRGHLQTTQHHGASQLSGGQHPALQHPAQHHPANQHLQQQYGQQYGGQQPINLPGPGQQLPSPYAQGLMGPGMVGGGGHRGHDGREGREGDPYSFVDEYTGPPPRPVEEILGHAQPKRRGRKPKHIKLMENGGDPLAIAAAQAAHEAKKRKWRQMGPDGKPLPLPVKPRKRIDRFDGISEDELSKKVLPDHLGPNLDIVIIGINPGLFAAYKGHHYAGPGNHFWKCLFLSGLIPEPLTSDDDHQLLDHGIGFTNIVARTTRGSADLTRKEIKEGGQILLAKLQQFQPRVAVFNGKGIYEIFSGKKEFTFGRQPEKIEGTHTHVWVMPSSSARCAQLPRALDKVPFYTALRKFRDFLKGTITELTEEEITFSCSKSSKHYKDCEKLEGPFEDDLPDPFLDDPLKDDLDSSRFESELDSEEISRSISQSLYNLSGMTREQLEALDCPTIPIRKKRGRPKKAPDDPNAPPRPKARTFPTDLMLCNGDQPPRKKRGRPKKVLEDGTNPPPKRPGRKPKPLKDMLAAQQGGIPGAPGIPHNPHSQLGMGHLNGMMSPSGYSSNPNAPPFSPQFGGHQGPPLNGPSHPGDIMSPGNPPHGMTNHHPSIPGAHNVIHGPHGGLHSGPGGLPSLHGGGGLPPPGCPTPNSSSGGSHNSLPPRGPTPQGFGQSPGYSSPVPGQLHPLGGSSFSHPPEKSDLQLEEERQLGLSPIPGSPVMAQPDFEPPTSLHEGEPLLGEAREPLQAQFSDPGTPADESSTPYQGYPPYPPPSTSCSPSYNSSVAPSPSFPPGVSHSPSYSPSVSCSPSYTPHNTHSPSYPAKSTQSPSYPSRSPSYPPGPTQSPSYPPGPTQSPSYPPGPTQSPSYPPGPTQSPSYPPGPTQSPSYPPGPTQSPSYPPGPTQSPSFPSVTHSPSFPPTTTHSPSYHSPSYPSNLTRSPSYPTTMTHSPSYPTTSSHSPSYRPQTSHSPSFPLLNKPLAPGGGVHSPQMKGDVSSKSLSGLESLVDQIPSLSETDGGAAVLSNGPCSNPTTPGPPPSDPFSPGHGGGPQSSTSSFQSFAGGGAPTSFAAPHYGSPQAPSNPYSPQYTSNSTNLSTNFSVSSLAGAGAGASLPGAPPAPFDGSVGAPCAPPATTSASSSSSASSTAVSTSAPSSSFSVASLTGDSPTTPTPSMYSNSYSPVPPGHSPQSYDVMGSSILPPTPPMGPSFMGSPNMGGLPSSMGMSGAQLPYPYPQYGESGPGVYTGPSSHSSFPYASSPGFHVPSPRFPYPSPYSRGYSQNSVLERIKQTGMGMGFGSF